MKELTPHEQAWLDFYRANPTIAAFLGQKWTGQIRINVHEGRLVNGDSRPHLALGGVEKR